MSGALQAVYQNQRGFAAPIPAAIGASYGGGYFAGQINVSGVVYNLVVSDQSVGQATNKTWGTVGVTTNIVSDINGPANSAALSALGAAYQAAAFCENLNTGGYTDWYLPAQNEMGVIYYFLKPGTFSNDTNSGANANAVFPQPINTNYASGDPAQTTATAFQTGNAQVVCPQFDVIWTSTEWAANEAQRVNFANGGVNTLRKDNTANFLRAVRRVLA